MRVLFVTNRYPTESAPGNSPAIEQQRRALRQLGHSVDVLFIRSQGKRTEYLRAIWEVFVTCQLRGRYDVVHAHYGYCGLVARAQRRCPVVVTFRGTDVMSPRQRPFSKLAASWADAAVVMTEEMRRLLGREDALVIPYGIDLDIFQPMDRVEARRQLGVSESAPLVLFPYNPRRVLKRFDLVEGAVELLKREMEGLELLTLHGEPPATLATYMNASDVMVLVSDTEGSPSAVREAMGCNLPIVSVDVGDVAATIRGIDGCYIADRTAEDIAAKLHLVLAGRRRIKGREALYDASTRSAALEIEALYARLVAGRSKGSQAEKAAAESLGEPVSSRRR